MTEVQFHKTKFKQAKIELNRELYTLITSEECNTKKKSLVQLEPFVHVNVSEGLQNSEDFSSIIETVLVVSLIDLCNQTYSTISLINHGYLNRIMFQIREPDLFWSLSATRHVMIDRLNSDKSEPAAKFDSMTEHLIIVIGRYRIVIVN